jgi:PH (Pleckstrin Homology) domain-containing protein
VTRARFRHNVSISLAGLVAFLGAIPVATGGFGDGTPPPWAYPLLLLLLIPLAVAVWGWRAGTDADTEGLRLRALVGSRRIGWGEVDAFVPAGRRVVARLTDGKTYTLPAVAPADLSRLVAASGHSVVREDADA